MNNSSLFQRLQYILPGHQNYRLPKYAFLAARLVLLIFIYGIYRLAFYIYNLDHFAGINYSELIIIFWGGIRFDLSGILYLNLLYFIAVLLPFYFVYNQLYQKIANIIFIIINIIGFLASSIDIIYYPFTFKRFTASVFKEFKNEQGLLSVFLNGLFDFWEITLFLVFTCILFIWLSNSFAIKKSGLTKRYYYIIHSILLPVILFLLINAIRGGFGRSSRPIAIADAGQYVKKPSQMALVLNTPFSMIRTLRQQKFSIIRDFNSEEELEAVFTPAKASNPKNSFNRKNVVILIIESFSKEHSRRLNPLLENGKYKGYIPFIDSLMGQSLYFRDAYATGRKSIDALPAIVAGIPYLRTHFVISNYSTNKIEGLGHILNKYGYDLSFFHGAPNGSMGFNSIMAMMGFKKYFGKDEFNDDSHYDGTWGIYDEEFLQFFAQQLNNMRQPFASVFFSLSSHHPWDVPKRYGDKFNDGPKGIFRTIRYTDWSVRQFFKTASQMPWYNNTIFVITADHAAYIYHDEYKNDIGAFAIPLVFYTPDKSLIGEDSRVASQLDVFPTLLDYLGIETPYFSFGNSLIDSTKERLAFNYTKGSYRIFQDSLVLEIQNNQVAGIYNYINDRQQKSNLLQLLPGKKAILEKKLRAIRQQFNNRMLKNEMTVR